MATVNASDSRLSGSDKKALASAGLGIGLALLGVVGRKIAAQAPAALAGNWDVALKAEHKAALALLDKLARTRDRQSARRAMLLAKLKHALAKHAFQEENAVYPAMRDAGMLAEADGLNSEHGYVKQYLYDLETLTDDNIAFQDKLSFFRSDLEKHMRDEEQRLFPRLRRILGEDANGTLTARMNREGLKLA